MSNKESKKTKFIGLRIVAIILCSILIILGIVNLVYGTMLNNLFGALPIPGIVQAIFQIVVGGIGILGALRLAKFVLVLFVIGTVVIFLFLIGLLVYLALVNPQLLLQGVILYSISMAFAIALIIVGVLMYKRAQRVCC